MIVKKEKRVTFEPFETEILDKIMELTRYLMTQPAASIGITEKERTEITNLVNWYFDY